MSRRHPRISECRSVRDFVRAGVLRPVQPATSSSGAIYGAGRCVYGPNNNVDTTKTTWSDISGLANNGTLTGFAWTAASGWDGSGLPSDPDFLVFSGDDDQVTVAASPDFQLSEYSLDVWMRSDIEDYDLCIFANGTYSKFLRWHNTYCILQQRIGGTARRMYFGDDPEIGVGNLCHVIATVKDGGQRFYVGGVEDEAARQSYAGAVDTGAGQAITLGLLSGDAWQGALASARLYGRVLTPTEAAQNHAAGPNGSGYVTSGLKLDLNAAHAAPQALTFTDYMTLTPTGVTPAGTKVAYQRSSGLYYGPVIVSDAAKSATWQADVVNAWHDPIRLVRDFMAAGDLIVPLNGDSTGYVKR